MAYIQRGYFEVHVCQYFKVQILEVNSNPFFVPEISNMHSKF